jgi:hypothetical protein
MQSSLILTIKLKKSELPEMLIMFQVIYVCIVRLLIDAGLPESATFVCDFINIILLVYCALYRRKRKLAYQSNRLLYNLILTFYVEGLFSAIFYRFNLILWMWSLRNFGRFDIFLFACATFINAKTIAKISKILKLAFAVNFVLVFYQFGILGNRGDYIGGLFGIEGGTANTWLNIFLIVCFSLYTSEWLHNSITYLKYNIILIAAVAIATVSELKFFYIELILIVIMGLIASKKNAQFFLRTLWISITIIVLAAISIPILYALFPNFNDFFHISTIINDASQSYTKSGDIGRLEVIPKVTSEIFGGDKFLSIFGIGMGNAEYSTLELFTSEFYKRWGVLHYQWFSDAVILIQNGLLGLILYALFFVASGVRCYKHYKSIHEIYSINKQILLVGSMLSMSAILLAIYNISLNTESAYLLYFYLGAAMSQYRNLSVSRTYKSGLSEE